MLLSISFPLLNYVYTLLSIYTKKGSILAHSDGGSITKLMALSLLNLWQESTL